jgi:hypothetical protein
MKHLLPLGFALMATLSATRARAAPTPDRVAIIVEGADQTLISEAIAGTLPENWSPADETEFSNALDAQGHHGSALAALAKPKTRDTLIARARKAAVAAHDRVVVFAKVTVQRGKRTIQLTVVDATKDDVASTTITQRVGRLDRNGKEKLQGAVASLLAGTEPPPAPAAPEPALTAAAAPVTVPKESPPAAPAQDEAVASARDTAGTQRAILDLSAGATLRSRHFEYTDGRTANLRPYDVDGVPFAQGSVELFPFARSSSVVARNIGLVGDAGSAVAFRSHASDGTDGRTSWTRYDAGLKVRIPFGTGPRSVVLGVLAQYGNEAFHFEDPAKIGGELPDAVYGFGRGAVDARIPLGPVAARARAAYLLVLEQGGVGGRFRDARAQGVEGSLGIAVPVARELEARAGANYTRFFYAFSPVVGDKYVAGGALDQMLGGELALALVLQ